MVLYTFQRYDFSHHQEYVLELAQAEQMLAQKPMGRKIYQRYHGVIEKSRNCQNVCLLRLVETKCSQDGIGETTQDQQGRLCFQMKLTIRVAQFCGTKYFILWLSF